jgi:dynein light intermediate chain
MKQTNADLLILLRSRMWSEENSGFWLRYASSVPSTRFDVLKLQEALDAKLLQRQARENGICPVREDLYAQAFDELIREVTLNSPERGLLLLRVRDELRLTTDAYKTLYDSSLTFGVRKQLQAEDGMGDLAEQIASLQRDKEESESRVAELTNKLEVIEKRAAERKALQEKKFKEELDFLKYQGQHLDAFLKSAGGGTTGLSAAGAGGK